MAKLTIIVKEGQTIFDLAVQYLGSLQGAYLLAERNNLPLDAELAAGQEIVYMDYDIDQPRLVQYFLDQGIDIATGGTIISPSPVIPVSWTREPFIVDTAITAIIWSFTASKTGVKAYWGIFPNTANPNKGDVLSGINAIDNGEIDINNRVQTRNIENLEAETEYIIASYLFDPESETETDLVKITVRTKAEIITTPEQTGGLPYVLSFTLGT